MSTAVDRPPLRVRRRTRTVLVGLLVVAAGLALARSGVIGHVSDADRLQSTIADAGVWAPALFLVLMVSLVPLNVPGLLFVIPATTLFGTVPGVVLSLVGGFLASAIGIVGARRLGREALRSRLPRRFLRMEARLSARGFWGVVLLRSVTFLMQPVDWLCGLTSMPMRRLLVATFVGLIPPTLVIALTGGGVLDVVVG